MDGHQYEYQCAKILKRKGFSKITVTKGSGDQGIDIIAYSGSKKYGIQCKYYTSPVGNHAVQEAYSGSKYYNCDIAAVMTNSTFTESAKELADKTGVLLWAKNKVPASLTSFKPTKYIGIFICIISILGLITLWNSQNINFLFLQRLEFIILILGGFFGIYEYGSWGMPFISSIFYMIAGFIDLFFSISSNSIRLFSCSFYIMIALVSFMRADFLHFKTNGYHIWKNTFQQFMYDNLKNISPQKHTLSKQDKKKISEIHHEIEELNNDIAAINESYNQLNKKLDNMQEASEILESIKFFADIANTTDNPEEFFKYFDLMIIYVNKLIDIPDVEYSEQPPKEIKRELNYQRQPAIQKMIDRYDKYISQNGYSYEIFYKTLSNYFPLMSDNNINYVSTIYKNKTALPQNRIKKKNKNNLFQSKRDCKKENHLSSNKSDKGKKSDFSQNDFDTFLWQCNSVYDARNNDEILNYSMKIDNPDDSLEMGYQNAMNEISNGK